MFILIIIGFAIHVIKIPRPHPKISSKITYVNAKIIESEPKNIGSYWVIDEIYIADGGRYEFHVIFDGEKGHHQLIVEADDIIYE